MRLRTGLLALVLGSTVLSGCGEHSAAPPAASGSLTRVSTTNAAPPSDGATDREALADLVAFTSPSGNVGCYLEPTTVRCDILERDWTPPPRPADCEFDYGQGITLSAGGEPTFICAGDTALGAGTPLAYGASISAGALRCDSAESGITCRDSTTTRGFAIAREGFRLF